MVYNNFLLGPANHQESQETFVEVIFENFIFAILTQNVLKLVKLKNYVCV